MTNFVKDDFQYGDIIATRGHSFLSKSIRYFMKLVHPKDKTSFSHIAVVINIYDEKYIAEALGWGVRIWSIEDSGYLKNEQVIICRDKEGFNTDKILALSKKCVGLGGTRYQYENFPQWVVKILFKWNWFKKSSEKAIYCSELGAIAINAAYPGTFPTPNSTSPADHYDNTKLYFIIDKNYLLD
jgi:hypothetical protein